MADVNEMQTYEALFKNQGARIMFYCDGVTYQGIISSIYPAARYAKLIHVKILGGDEYFRLLRFNFKELAAFTVIESAESVNKYSKNEYLINILRNNKPVKSDVVLKVLFDDRLSYESEDETPEENTEEKKFVLDLPEHLAHKLPKDYLVVDAINEDFNQSIQNISSQKLIGVAFHGSGISRFRKVAWMCISTDVYLYVFDIQKLEKEAFEKGLRGVLENKSIKKIIHDCSYPADCLAHHYTTHLTNVFDTRIADYVAHVQRYNGKYEFNPFSSLDSCLRYYLNVPQDFLFERETSKSSSRQDCVSMKRPISNDYLYDILKSVVYLKLLQEELTKELLTPLYRSTGFYRTVLAKSDQQLIDLLGNNLSRPDMMLPSLFMYGIQTARFVNPQVEKYEKLSLCCSFINPKSGEIIQSNSNLGSKEEMINDSIPKYKRKEISEISNEESVVNKAVNQVTNFKTDKAIVSYLGSPAAVKKAAIQSTENRKKTSMTETVNNCEATSSKTSFMRINKIYHRASISEMYPGGFDNIENLKTINYISKFSARQPLSFYFDTTGGKTNSDGGETHGDFDVSNSSSNKEFEESKDIWLRLRSEFLAEKATSSALYNEREISFVPG